MSTIRQKLTQATLPILLAFTAASHDNKTHAQAPTPIQQTAALNTYDADAKVILVETMDDIKKETSESLNCIFYLRTEDCIYCDAMTPILKETAKNYSRIPILKLDAENSSWSDFLKKNDVKTYPTGFLLQRDNLNGKFKIKKRFEGYQPIENIHGFIHQYLRTPNINAPRLNTVKPHQNETFVPQIVN